VDFARLELGFDPDEVQERVLRHPGRRVILNCSRQWGKSTLTAAKAIHRAWTKPDSLIVVVSPTERQSGEFVRKAREFVIRLGVKPRGDGHNSISVLFPNRSRIVGLPGTEATVRGFSKVSLLVVDEAARVRDEQFKAVMPMLAVGNGDLWLMSTPFGKRGFFWTIWDRKDEAWARISVPVTECARISREFLDGQKEDMGEAWYQQEYMCQFSGVNDSVFDRDLLLASVSESVAPLW
jgi:hypothetical protein